MFFTHFFMHFLHFAMIFDCSILSISYSNGARAGGPRGGRAPAGADGEGIGEQAGRHAPTGEHHIGKTQYDQV